MVNYPADDMTLPFAELIRSLGPGVSIFPNPCSKAVSWLRESRVVGGSHLKMQLRPVDGIASLDAIAFRRLPEDLPDSDTVRLVYKLDVNHFRGHKTCQLMVEQILAETGLKIRQACWPAMV